MNEEDKGSKRGFRFGDPEGRNKPPRRGPPTQSQNQDPKAPPVAVQKVRSAHGTRVARSIVCTSCGAKDTIHFAPRDPDRALCRSCAAKILGAVDADANIRAERHLECIKCGRGFNTSWEEPETFECTDCRAGIETVQKNRANKAQRVSGKVLRVRAKDPQER